MANWGWKVSWKAVGSTFWVDVPATDLPLETTTSVTSGFTVAPKPEPTAPTSTLLYIEDQRSGIFASSSASSLHHPRPEYKLLSAMQGRLGLELAQEHRPDVILLDLNLPDIPGEEVLARIKADPTLCDIPVIMVSADAMGDRIDHLMASGASNYLTKPYKVAEFLRVIHDTLVKHLANGASAKEGATGAVAAPARPGRL